MVVLRMYMLGKYGTNNMALPPEETRLRLGRKRFIILTGAVEGPVSTQGHGGGARFWSGGRRQE